jgi:hypothetical protein
MVLRGVDIWGRMVLGVACMVWCGVDIGGRMVLGVAWCCVVLTVGVGWCWVLHVVARGVDSGGRMVLGVAWCCVVLTLGKQHSDRVSRLAVFAVFKHVVGLCKHPFWGALLRLQHAERASSGDNGKQGQFARLR